MNKKKVGTLFGRPIVECPKELVTKNEYHIDTSSKKLITIEDISIQDYINKNRKYYVFNNISHDTIIEYLEKVFGEGSTSWNPDQLIGEYGTLCDTLVVCLDYLLEIIDTLKHPTNTGYKRGFKTREEFLRISKDLLQNYPYEEYIEDYKIMMKYKRFIPQGYKINDITSFEIEIYKYDLKDYIDKMCESSFDELVEWDESIDKNRVNFMGDLMMTDYQQTLDDINYTKERYTNPKQWFINYCMESMTWLVEDFKNGGVEQEAKEKYPVLYNTKELLKVFNTLIDAMYKECNNFYEVYDYINTYKGLEVKE